MRKSIRIVRLIRRRRFRYRRLHAWRLDVLAVMILFGMGWLLLPLITEVDPTPPAAPFGTQISVVEKPLIDREEAVLSPAMFAFTTPEGFAHGVVATQLDEMGSQISFVRPNLTRFYSRSIPERFLDSSWAGLRLIDFLKLPPPPDLSINARSNGLPTREVRVQMSIPGIVPKGHFSSSVENIAAKSVRISVHFGSDGRADSAVLFSHLLDAADAARVERATMRLTGPPNESAWIILMPRGD